MPVNEPLPEEAVHTQEQRNQAWTEDGEGDPRRQDQKTTHEAGDPPPTLDLPQALEDELDDIEANPSSDAEETGDAKDGIGDASSADTGG